MKVTWDEAKNRADRRNHGISFDEAAQLFRSGVDYLEVLDEAHSDFEDPFVVKRGLVLVVWTERDEDTVRIISARWATAKERDLYHSFAEGA